MELVPFLSFLVYLFFTRNEESLYTSFLAIHGTIILLHLICVLVMCFSRGARLHIQRFTMFKAGLSLGCARVAYALLVTFAPLIVPPRRFGLLLGSFSALATLPLAGVMWDSTKLVGFSHSQMASMLPLSLGFASFLLLYFVYARKRWSRDTPLE
jgi:hypothetical protein